MSVSDMKRLSMVKHVYVHRLDTFLLKRRSVCILISVHVRYWGLRILGFFSARM